MGCAGSKNIVISPVLSESVIFNQKILQQPPMSYFGASEKIKPNLLAYTAATSRNTSMSAMIPTTKEQENIQIYNKQKSMSDVHGSNVLTRQSKQVA